MILFEYKSYATSTYFSSSFSFPNNLSLMKDITFKNLSFQNDRDCLNKRFSSFKSLICLSLTLLFLVSVSTLNCNQ